MLMSLRPIHLLRFLLLCLCSVSLFSFVFSSKNAHAFDSPITIVAQTTTVHFPGSIDFTVTATDTANAITTATIYITYKDVPYGNAASYSVPISKPAQKLTLDYRNDTSHTSSFHSPGTPVEYYWVLQDSASRQFAEQPQDFTTVDTRYSWQHLSQGLLQVNWYNRPAAFGQLLLGKANDSITHISAVLGSGLRRQINLWVYASNGDFHGALAPNSYEWVGGEAHPFLNEAFISVIDVNDDTLIRDMPHELTHLVFHQLIVQGPIPPTWFDEGMAVYNQLYHEPDMQARFEQALSTHSLLRLYTITDGFPADADAAYLAYAQSWDLIRYMYRTFGQAKMTQLIQNMNNVQTDFDQQLTQAIGMDSLHLENQWRLQLGQSTVLTSDLVTPTPQPIVHPTQNVTATDNTTPILITSGVLLILLPILGIVAIFAFQRRKRQRVVAAQVAQGYMATNTGVQPYVPYAPNQPYPPFQANGSSNYTNPAQYMPQTNIPFSYPVAESAFGGPAQFPQQPQSPQWSAEWPTASNGQFAVNGNNGNNGYYSDTNEPPAEAFGSFQEGIQQQPRKQAPQE